MKGETLKRCPECGEFHEGLDLPRVTPNDFERARTLADFVWHGARADISVIGVTAALLTKRVAVSLRIPRTDVRGVAALYLELASRIIAIRRKHKAENKDAN